MSAMSNSDMPIRPLPPEVAAKIRSSVRITHLNEVALELVKNALDADAQSITIIVDFRRGGLIVQDDGHGIPPTEFEEGSGLAQAHSKFCCCLFWALLIAVKIHPRLVDSQPMAAKGYS